MEAAMINDGVLERIVVKAWKYADDLLFRLTCYRDPDLPQKPHNKPQDGADFVMGTQEQAGRAGGVREELSRPEARFPAKLELLNLFGTNVPQSVGHLSPLRRDICPSY
jgi:hypothetical protein